MATLNTLTLNGDGTIGAVILHDAGTGSPFYTHCNDVPDGSSADWVANNTAEVSGDAYFALSATNSDFGTMSTLSIDVDVQAISVSNDLLQLEAIILTSEGGTALTDQVTVATQADTTRTQRTINFQTVVQGNKSQWDGAVLFLTWTYQKISGPDNTQLKIFGCRLNGTYNVFATPKMMGLLGVG